MTLLPASFRACTWGQTTALPMPPPTQTTVLPVGISVGLPRGPARSWISSPTSSALEHLGGLADFLERPG